MELVVHIPDDLEPSLRDAANREGVEPARWASDALKERLKQHPLTEDEQARSDRLKASFKARVARLRENPPAVTGAPQKGLGKQFADGVAEKLRKQGVTGGEQP